MPKTQDQSAADATVTENAAPDAATAADATVTENAAPDAATAAAGKAMAAAKAAGKTDEQIVDAAQAERDRQAAARAKVKQKHYKTVHGGVMIDPDTLKEFNGENAVKSPMTAWLEFQIANGKIAEDQD